VTVKSTQKDKHAEIKKGGSCMKIQEIHKIAKMWGVDTKAGRSKQDIIRDIQVSEGHSPCFHTKDTCDQDCLWKKDCINKY
jgi:hypothetical protein